MSNRGTEGPSNLATPKQDGEVDGAQRARRAVRPGWVARVAARVFLAVIAGVLLFPTLSVHVLHTVSSRPVTVVFWVNVTVVSILAVLRSGRVRRVVKRLSGAIDSDRRISLPVVGAWLGLITGLYEALRVVTAALLTAYIPRVPMDIIWMAPLTNAILFAGVGLGLSLLGRVFELVRRFEVATTVLLTLSFLTVTLQYTALHPLSQLILAVGVAAQVARYLASRQRAQQALIRATFGWIALPRLLAERRGTDDRSVQGPTRREFIASAALVAGSVALVVSADRLASRVSRGAASRAAGRRPNILLVVWDTVRAASTSLHGYARRTTPMLEAFASEAVTFDMAIAPAPWTLPTHAAMFTGRHVHEMGVDWYRALDDTFPTLAELSSGQGYATAGFVANLIYTQRHFGLARGFNYYDDFPHTVGQAILTTSLGNAVSDNYALRERLNSHDLLNRRPAEQIVASFLDWHRRLDGQPYFAFLNLYDAHAPYWPPEPYATRYAPHRPSRMDHLFGTLTDTQVLELQAAYDGAISYADVWFGHLVETLRTRGDLENTYLISLSDHGEEFNEHGYMDHAFSLYLPSVHVPFQIRLPEARHAGRRIRDAVSLRDVAATLDEILTLDRAVIPGHSLLPLIEGTDAPTSGAVSELRLAPWAPEYVPDVEFHARSIVKDGLHYIHYEATGQELLFDVEADYWELNDLTPTASGAREVGAMRRELERQLAG